MVGNTETLRQRDGRYGKFERNAGVSQELKEVMRGATNWDYLSIDKREALEMIAVKISRILNGDPDYKDSWLDIAGYAKLVEQALVSPTFNQPTQLTIDLDDPNVSVIPSAA